MFSKATQRNLTPSSKLYRSNRTPFMPKPKVKPIFFSTLLVTVTAFLVQPLSMSTAQAEKAPQAQQLNKEFHKIAQEVSPAVVHITPVREVERRANPFGRGGEHPFERFFGDEFMERFFDAPRSPRGRSPRDKENRKYQRKGLGSGVIVDSKKGYVLTNYHVVRKATKVEVKLGQHKDFQAEIVGTDPATDLAVLQIDGNDLPEAAELASGDDIKVGHHVLAMGNPFGLDRTITSGIISATGRENIGIAEYESFIQTDAAINPGNSGGPLVNMDGKVIGISTAIFSRSGGHMGIGFAVPVDMVKSVMKELIAQGEVTRGYLGVRIQEFTPALAQALDTDIDHGALVADVMDDTPAAEAGLKRGDIIVELNGEKVEGVTDLRNQVAKIDPGSTVDVTVLRDNERTQFTVDIGQRPKDERPLGSGGEEQWDLGIDVQNISRDIKERFGIERETGVLVTSVDRGSPGARAGLRPGMVILKVNRLPVKNVEEFRTALKEVPKENKLLLLTSYKGSTSYILVEPMAGE